MAHEQWMRRSEQALERSWLRALSQRDRDAQDPRRRAADPPRTKLTDALREPVAAGAER